MVSFVILCILFPAFKAMVCQASIKVHGKPKTETLLPQGDHSLVQIGQFIICFFKHKFISHTFSALHEESSTFDSLAYQQGYSTTKTEMHFLSLPFSPEQQSCCPLPFPWQYYIPYGICLAPCSLFSSTPCNFFCPYFPCHVCLFMRISSTARSGLTGVDSRVYFL